MQEDKQNQYLPLEVNQATRQTTPAKQDVGFASVILMDGHFARAVKK